MRNHILYLFSTILLALSLLSTSAIASATSSSLNPESSPAAYASSGTLPADTPVTPNAEPSTLNTPATPNAAAPSTESAPARSQATTKSTTATATASPAAPSTAIPTAADAADAPSGTEITDSTYAPSSTSNPSSTESTTARLQATTESTDGTSITESTPTTETTKTTPTTKTTKTTKTTDGTRVALFSSNIEQGARQLSRLGSLLDMHHYAYRIVSPSELLNGSLKPGPGYLSGPQGEKFYTLIIPSQQSLPSEAKALLSEFCTLGGQLIFWGKGTPLQMPDYPKATLELLEEWTLHLSRSLPEPEFKVLSRAPHYGIRYSRRICEGNDLFTLSNSAASPITFTASFDAAGRIFEGGTEIPSHMQDDRVQATLTLDPGQTRILSVRRSVKDFNILDFGADNSGSILTTAAIQAAADAAYANGGGTVVIPPGRYLTGALFFSNGVNLNLQEGAELLSSLDSDHFPYIMTRFEGVEKAFRCALLNFDNSRDVRVYGGGTINGRGLEWRKASNKDGLWGRPRMICFTNCPGGSISGLTMINHASWCLHVLYTDGFTISKLNIKVDDYIPSSDGVDIDSSSNILMTDVYTAVTDDCLSIKSGKNEDGRRVARPTTNVTVRNCNFDMGHGVAIGSEISGCIRDVLIEDCVCGEANQGPVRFKSQPSRGGIVENITFKNFKLNGCENFLDVNLMWRMVEDYPEYTPRTLLRNIRVIGVKGNVNSVGMIIGDSAAPIKEGTFIFEDCHITATRDFELKNVEQKDFSGIKVTIRPDAVSPVRFKHHNIR